MRTEAQIRASLKHEAQRAAAGDCRLSVWVSASDMAFIDRQAKAYGSRSKAVRAAIEVASITMDRD